MSGASYTIQAAGAEMDEVVANHWKWQWLANGRPASMLTDDQMEKMLAYIANSRAQLQHQSFVAMSRSGEVIGSVACQLWSGPIPHVFTERKVGTCWGVFVHPEWRRQGVATSLMHSVIDHWRSIDCQRGVLLCASEEARRVYERLGFGAGHMLLSDLQQQSKVDTGTGARTDGIMVVPAGEEADAHVAEHWRAVWLESGMTEFELVKDLTERTTAFATRARQRLEYQAFLAKDKGGAVVGSASSQVWEGPGSNNHTWQRLIKIGVVWGVYVRPKHRGCGIEAELIKHVVTRFKAIGCTKGFAVAASDEDVAMHRDVGFEPQNAMVIELDAKSPCSTLELCEVETPAKRPRAETEIVETVEAVEATLAAEDESLTTEEEAFVTSMRASGVELVQPLSTRYLASLRLALPQMVEAAFPAHVELRKAVFDAQAECGTFIKPEDNWFTQNIARFGAGFDMKELTSQPGLLANKFDRLSSKYDQWTVGNGCTYYHWIARAAAAASEELRGRDANILDVACGIGLPGHMLRLCGFQGLMAGTDISPGMLRKARERRVFDKLFVADANNGLLTVKDSSVDLLVCVGAMELLDHATVLAEFARVLRPGGKLWASFQWEGAVDESGVAVPNPTVHQNVWGVTLGQLITELNTAGFDTSPPSSIERSACAFNTPSSKQDGTLLPVPYLYVSVGLL